MTKALLNRLSLNAPDVWVAKSGTKRRAPNRRTWLFILRPKGLAPPNAAPQPEMRPAMSTLIRHSRESRNPGSQDFTVRSEPLRGLTRGSRGGDARCDRGEVF